jgi:hypothetical protein
MNDESQATPPPEPTLPFEDPAQPAVAGLIETVKLFITDPTTAFRRMSLTIDVFRPLIYGVLMGWIGQAVAFVFALMFPVSILGFLSGVADLDEISPLLAMGFGIGLFQLILAPIFIAIGLFIYSLIVHLCLMIVGGDKSGFGATFRVLCYGNTSQLAQIVPFVGGTIAFVWSLILVILGLTQAHRTTTGKAVAAVLLPLLACCVCVAIAVAMAVAFGIGADSWR